MLTPLISIILPVYNGSRYIEQSIDSCLNQTYDNIELIIVDDRSTDNTPKIATKHAARDSRVRVITHRENKRLPAALNTGHRAAFGPLLTWTSDDNLYKPNAIAKMVHKLLQAPAADIAYANVEKIDESGHILEYFKTAPAEELPIMNNMGACFLYKKEVWLGVGGYDEGLFGVEDYAFWLKCYNAGCKFRQIPESLYLYRIHSQSLTSQRTAAINQLAISLVCENNEKQKDRLPDVIRMRSYLKATRLAMNNDDRELARRCYQKALDISPDAPHYTYQSLIDYATK